MYPSIFGKDLFGLAPIVADFRPGKPGRSRNPPAVVIVSSGRDGRGAAGGLVVLRRRSGGGASTKSVPCVALSVWPALPCCLVSLLLWDLSAVTSGG